MNNTKPCQLLGSILNEARSIAILFGILNEKNRTGTYYREKNGAHNLKIEKWELPDKVIRLDILYLDDAPIGSILSLRILPSLYHMVGMYIDEKYRSKQINETLPDYYSLHPKENDKRSPSTCLLKSYLNDMVALNNYQVTLEVINNNQSAWRLYEKPLLRTNDNEKAHGFRLLTKEEILQYANLRGKKVGKWHPVNSGGESLKYGVQWSHIPDYGGKPERWSTNRIYIIGPGDQVLNVLHNKHHPFLENLKKLYSIIIYGSVIRYIHYKISSRFLTSD